MDWRSVLGFESTYRVSNTGIVQRLIGFWCQSNRELKRHVSNSGHLRVSLSVRGERNPQKFLVHRLVVEAFRGPIPDGLTVNHINGIKTDNRLENLELCTMSQQMRHAYRTGLQAVRRGEARGRVAKLTEKQVRQIRAMYQPGVITCAEIAPQFGVSEGCIQSIVTRRRWKHI